MTLHQSRENKKIIAGAATKVDISLSWLTGVFLLCVLLVFGLRGYFNDLEEELRTRGANERARLFVGEEIVRLRRIVVSARNGTG